MSKGTELQHDMEGVKEEVQLPNEEILAQLPKDQNIVSELLDRGLLPAKETAVALRHIVDSLWDNTEEYE